MACYWIKWRNYFKKEVFIGTQTNKAMITRAHNRSRLALTFFPLLVVTALLLPSAPIRVRGDDPKLSPEMIKALENVARFSKKEVFIVMAEDVEGESLATVVHYVRRKKLLGPIRKLAVEPKLVINGRPVLRSLSSSPLNPSLTLQKDGRRQRLIFFPTNHQLIK